MKLFNNSLFLYCCFFRVNDHTRISDEDDSEDDVDEGDFTVYECPGLANVS